MTGLVVIKILMSASQHSLLTYEEDYPLGWFMSNSSERCDDW